VEFSEGISQQFGRVQVVAGGYGETAGCWVPKYHSIGVVAAAKGYARVGLVPELGLLGTRAFDGTSKVANTAELIENAVVGADAVE
jgi:hypothetical protein